MYVAAGGGLTLAGSTITGNNARFMGGGVYLAGEGASFTIASGAVTGNTAGGQGGGVYINGSAAFTIPDGSVTDNDAPAGSDIAASDGAYKVTYAVTIDEAIEGGTVTADKTSAHEGDTITLTVTPGTASEDGRLMALTVRCGGETVPVSHQEDEAYTFTMPAADAEACAYVEEAKYTVSLSDGLNDVEFMVGNDIMWDRAPRQASYGERVEVRYLRTDESELQSMAYTYTLNGECVTADIPFTFDGSFGYYNGTFVMPDGDVAVTVSYETLHAINRDWSADSYGTAAASPERAVPGQTVTLYADPQDAYGLAGWRVTGVSSGASVTVSPVAGNENACRFVMPDEDVTFIPDFVKVFYEVLQDPSMRHGIVSVTGGSGARPGDTVTFTLVPAEHFSAGNPEVTVAGEPYAFEHVSGDTYTFIMPGADVTVSAAFAMDNNWEALRAVLAEGGEVTLPYNYRAEGGDVPLVVPRGVNVSLDLNGHWIDGEDLIDEGVLTVLGRMTLTDSVGSGQLSGSIGVDSVVGVYGASSR